MKKLLQIIILLLAVVNTSKIQAQKTENDTIQQIKEISQKKEKYIGKKFGMFLEDQKIKPVKIISMSPHNNINAIYITSLYFSNSINQKYLITIAWQDYIPKNEVKKIEQSNNFKITKKEKNILKEYIIKDIITNY